MSERNRNSNNRRSFAARAGSRLYAAADGMVKGLKGVKAGEIQSIDYDIAQLTGGGTRFDQYQNFDNLVKKKGLKVYDDMMKDGAVRQAIDEKRFTVISADWEVQPASEDKRDVEIADFIEWTLTDMAGSAERFAFDVLSAFIYGYSVSEKVLKPIKSGQWAGRWGLSEIKPVKPHELELKFDDHGTLVEIWQQTPNGATFQMDLPRFVIYSYNGEFGRVWGRSDLRAVYKHWWSKDFLIKWWNIYMETFGAPTRVGKYPAEGATTAQKDGLKNVLDSIMNSTSITIPDDMSVDFLAHTGQAAFEAAVKYHDSEIHRCIMGQTLTSGEGQRVGSMALGNVHQETKEDYTTFVRKELSESVFREQIIKPLVDLNWLGVSEYPWFVWQPRKGKIRFSNIYEVTNAMSRGVFLDSDYDRIREMIDLPATGEPYNPDAALIPPITDSGTATTEDVADVGAFCKQTPGAHCQPVKPLRRVAKAKAEPCGCGAAHDFAAKAIVEEPLPEEWKPAREFTRAEQNIGGYSYFAKQHNERRTWEEKLIAQMRPAFKKMRESMLKNLRENVYENGRIKATAVDNLAIDKEAYNEYRTVMWDAIGEIFHGQYIDGLKVTGQKRESIPDPVKTFAAATVPLKQTPPADVLAEIDKWAESGDWKKVKKNRDRLGTMLTRGEQEKFWMTDVVDLDILKSVKAEINGAVSNGISEDETMKNIKRVFDDYGADELATPGRLRAIARTNITKAFADAHLADYSDPVVMRDFPMVQYSAVIDAVTTETCAALDGKVFRSDDPDLTWITPPKHFNCRSDIVPVDADDPLVAAGPSKKPNRDDIPAGFGGTKE